jgi:hypothetical protein
VIAGTAANRPSITLAFKQSMPLVQSQPSEATMTTATQTTNMNSSAVQISISNLFNRGTAVTLARLASYIDRFAEGARDGREIAARYRELSQLSPAELTKRGLDRQSIARAALNGH